MYERGNQTYLDMLLSATGFGDLLNKGEYIEEITRYDREMLIQFQETRAYVDYGQLQKKFICLIVCVLFVRIKHILAVRNIRCYTGSAGTA